MDKQTIMISHANAKRLSSSEKTARIMTNFEKFSNMSHPIIATSALIYANGPIHIGHMLEAIQTDIWVRHQKMQGRPCLYLCGSDAHGTPIMLNAEKKSMTPDAMVAHYHQEHKQNLEQFLIDIDCFHSTHSEENRLLSESIFRAAQDRGDIHIKEVIGAFDQSRQMFLPDRFVKGTCPRCGAEDQYGDACEVCGATYNTQDLINPYSVLSGEPPCEKASNHYFFALDHYTEFLSQWLRQGHVQEQVANKLYEWIEQGLNPWDISRDAPYFGFRIPESNDQYFYVWLDAPIGYIASLEAYLQSHPDSAFANAFSPESSCEIRHFIGKDIIAFHAVFWPALLKSANKKTPSNIHAHGFLTVNGQKMSKSRGTFITAKDYLDHLNPEYLRYYFASKLGNGIDDLDLNLDEFMQKVNSDLVGKVINIASRCAGFIHKLNEGRLAKTLDKTLTDALNQKVPAVLNHYQQLETHKAVRLIMEMADQTNQFIDTHKPWQMAKNTQLHEKTVEVCTTGLNAFRIIIGLLKPILPHTATNAETFLACDSIKYGHLTTPLLDHVIQPFKPLMQRINADTLEQFAGIQDD